MPLGCCGYCAAFRPRYKKLVDHIFPPNPEDGLVKSNMEKLVWYAMHSPDKLDRIGEYLAHRLHRDIQRRRIVGSFFSYGLNESDFPSMEEETTTDTIEESDLALTDLTPQHGRGSSLAPTEETINFVPSHFGDSSDDEEEEFAIGLAFDRNVPPPPPPLPPPHIQAYPPQNHVAAAAANVVMNQIVERLSAETASTIFSSIGQQIASAMTTTSSNRFSPAEERSVVKSPLSDSSFDDEFEFISDDELQ